MTPRSTRRGLGIAAAALLAACAGGDTIEPSDATAEDLYGWWQSADGHILGFAPRSEAVWEMRFAGGLTAPHGMISYLGGSIGTDWRGTMAYDVAAGQLETTILAGALGGAGLEFSQELIAITPGAELQLRVDENGVMTTRTYAAVDRCPRVPTLGWLHTSTDGCESYFAAATSVAFDGRGRMHHLVALAGVDTSCTYASAYGVAGKSCDAGLNEFPAMRYSALRIGDDRVHAAYTTQYPFDAAQDQRLVYQHRHLDDETWTIEHLGRASLDRIFLGLRPGGAPSILYVEENDRVVIAERTGDAAWTFRDAADTADALLAPTITAATLSATGRWALMNGPNLAIEGASGRFTVVAPPLPVTSGFGAAVAWDALDRVHVAWVHENVGSNPDGVGGTVLTGHGAYAVVAEGVFGAVHDMGLMTYPLMDAPGLVAHGMEKAADTPWYLSRVDAAAGLIETRFIDHPLVGGGASPETWRSPTMAVADDGRIAVIGVGQRIYEGRADSEVAETASLTFDIQGAGRIYSDDGRVDCESTCVVDLPLGAVLRLRTASEPPHDHLATLPCIPYESLFIGTCTHVVLADEVIPVDF